MCPRCCYFFDLRVALIGAVAVSEITGAEGAIGGGAVCDGGLHPC